MQSLSFAARCTEATSLKPLPPPTPQVHGLEQEVAAAVDTSARLQRQRANLTTTLDVLRAMEGVAQVGGEHTDALKRRLFAWGSEQLLSALGSRHTVAPNHGVITSPAPHFYLVCRRRARCRACCPKAAALRLTTRGQ